MNYETKSSNEEDTPEILVNYCNDNLYKTLLEYKNRGCYPMHMPGHKRNSSLISMLNPYEIDFTEIDGLDNLHDADGILEEAMNRAANLYGSEHTDYLINGSTSGILAAVSAAVNRGDKILVSRNCHKSVYNAVFLNGLIPIYLYPRWDSSWNVYRGVTLEQIKTAVEQEPDIKTVVITSPTYEGFVSDVEQIAKYLHNKNISLIVDEAHGSHFGFDNKFPENSIKKGADVVIHSVHKTLPSLTQTALIHVNSDIIKYARIKEYLAIYQTSSPSYVLMCSIDRCISMLEADRAKLFMKYRRNREGFDRSLCKLNNIRVYIDSSDKYDMSKLLISVKGTNINGMMLYNRLREEFKIQMEMCSADYVLGMTSIADTLEGFQMLQHALLQIDSEIYKLNNNDTANIISDFFTINQKLPLDLSPLEAYNREKEIVALYESGGRISGEYIYLYPPGSPILAPGERISPNLLLYLKELYNYNIDIKGLKDRYKNTIEVII